MEDPKRFNRIEVMNLVTSYQLGHISRRQFTRRAMLAVGSIGVVNMLLAACQAVPINAPAPTMIAPPADTPEPEAEATAAPTEEAMEEAMGSGEMVTYPDRDGEELTGYLARPSGDGPAPAVVVIQEWWGLNDHIKDLADRFAAEGFVALAPDLYKGNVATEPDEARKLVMELDMMEAVAEIDQAMAFLLDQEYVAGDKAGVVGFCMGGGLVLQAAVNSDRVGAAIPFYGTLLEPDQAAQVKAPVQAHYGTADRFDLDALAEMGRIINEDTEFDAEVYTYQDAPHAFMNDTSESYRAEAATEAWERTLTWFRTYLG
ncbi:MAG: dienelactone hydrolase family protein [Caldilineaceae bacterium]|nr:dienelactone hydrolase family protein [Caldilineaceae bacterium]